MRCEDELSSARVRCRIVKKSDQLGGQRRMQAGVEFVEQQEGATSQRLKDRTDKPVPYPGAFRLSGEIQRVTAAGSRCMRRTRGRERRGSVSGPKLGWLPNLLLVGRY